MNSSGIAAKDYSFAPVGAVDPNAPVVVAESYYNGEKETPSDTAIMVGCGTLGCLIGGPFCAIITALGGKYAADKSKGPIGESTKDRENRFSCGKKGQGRAIRIQGSAKRNVLIVISKKPRTIRALR